MAVVGSGAASAAIQRATGLRLDPLGSYNFNVEIEGILVGGFMEAKGLEATTDVLRYQEGGKNLGDLVFPGRTKFSDITLTHGMTISDSLYLWYMDIANGSIKKKNATIYLMSHLGLPLKWWNLINCFPVKWVGPTFNASKSGVAVEVLTIVHEGMSKPTLGI